MSCFFVCVIKIVSDITWFRRDNRKGKRKITFFEVKKQWNAPGAKVHVGSSVIDQLWSQVCFGPLLPINRKENKYPPPGVRRAKEILRIRKVNTKSLKMAISHGTNYAPKREFWLIYDSFKLHNFNLKSWSIAPTKGCRFLNGFESTST